MITLKLVLDTRRIKEDGTFPLVYRITYLGTSRDISLKIYLQINEWDSKAQIIKSKNLREIYQPVIDQMKLHILSRTNEYLMHSKSISTIQGLKDFITGTTKHDMNFKQYWEFNIATFKQEKRYGNAAIHESSIKLLNELKSLSVPIKAVDYGYLVYVQSKLIERGCKANTVSVYLRCLRKIWIIAIKEKLVKAEFYPFNDFKIKSEVPAPTTINLREMKCLFQLQIEQQAITFDSLNYAKLIFCLRGINFKDLALLTKENYAHGKITYKRAKTGKIYTIAATETVTKILQYYSDPERRTLVPILSNSDLKAGARLHTIIKQKTKTCNKHLTKLGQMSKLEIKLTTYVFRYSWANIARSLGYPKDLIAEALGHEYGNSVTGVYLNDFDTEQVDEMNLKVCNKVVSPNHDFA
jgi:integrase